jgi:hypothetical protein
MIFVMENIHLIYILWFYYIVYPIHGKNTYTRKKQIFSFYILKKNYR